MLGRNLQTPNEEPGRCAGTAPNDDSPAGVGKPGLDARANLHAEPSETQEPSTQDAGGLPGLALAPPPPVAVAPPPLSSTQQLLPPARREPPSTPRFARPRAAEPAVRRGWKTRFYRSLTSTPAILLFGLVILPGVVLGLRNGIVRHAPAIAPAYAAIGMPVNLDGLDFRNVTSVLKKDAGGEHLLVQGEIVNLRKNSGALPNLKLELKDKKGLPMYSWRAPSPRKRIDAHASIRFVARLDSPPGDAANVKVRFARAHD